MLKPKAMFYILLKNGDPVEIRTDVLPLLQVENIGKYDEIKELNSLPEMADYVKGLDKNKLAACNIQVNIVNGVKNFQNETIRN